MRLPQRNDLCGSFLSDFLEENDDLSKKEGRIFGFPIDLWYALI